MYYRKLRQLYRDRGQGRTHIRIAEVLGASEYYARKCLRTGSFTIQDKLLILRDLDMEDQPEKVFPTLGG